MPSCPCKWKDFVKWIKPFTTSASDVFKGAPDNVIESYVRRVAHDFAMDSGVLRKRAYFDLVCGVADYPIMSVENEDIISYKKVTVNGCELTKNQYRIIDEILYLERKPCDDIEEGICIEYSYAPCTDVSCEVPDDFCTRYRSTIIDGVLAEMLSMESMDWYSPAQADKRQDKYDLGVSRASCGGAIRFPPGTTRTVTCTLVAAKPRCAVNTASTPASH